MLWSTYRNQIRRSILHDDDKSNWSDDQLLDYCVWALDTFCAHTAKASAILVDPATQTLPVPDNAYTDIETTGMLYFTDSTGIPLIIQPSRMLDFSDTTDNTFTIWENEISISAAPPVAGQLVLRYFAYYPHPVEDSDPITLPTWALAAVAHLIGALALTSVSIQSSTIDRWKDKRDSGNPEDNALRIEQSHLMKFYENELLRVPRQQRENYYQRLLV